MIKHRQFWLFGFIILMALACGKKQQPMIQGSEEQSIDVEIPKVDWQKTVVVAPADSEITTQALTVSIRRRLGHRGFKMIAGSGTDEFKADYVVLTKTSNKQNQLEISYTLKDVQKDSILENSVAYEEEGVFTAVETVSQQVSKSIGDTSIYQIQSESVSNLVFQQFIEAESFRQQGTPAAYNTAVRKYKEILRNDSLFTEAWIGLAESYLMLIEQGWERPHVWLSLAQQSGFKLQTLSPESGEGECILGRVAVIRGDYRGAENYFRQAIEINPNLIAAWRGLGQIFGQYGLYHPALQMYDRALELDPSNLQAGISKALILGGQGDTISAIDLLKQLIVIHPNVLYLNSFLALQLYYQGQLEQAMEAVRMGLADASYQPLSHAILAMIQVKQGDLDSALGEVELEVKPQAEGNGSLATAVAAIYSLLGRKGEAVQWLDRAVQWGYKEYPWLVKDPNFSSLQGDERFQVICDTLKVAYNQRMKMYSENRVM